MNAFFEKLTTRCHSLLLKNKKLLGYLEQRRGITSDTIHTYKIGAFPSDLRDLYEPKGDMNAKELVENGIIWNAEKSPFKRYPIVIPINNIFGKTIAIGCRTLLSDTRREELGIPKYRNSVYSKTSYLFGLDRAYKAIRALDKVFVVEGYFDTLTAHQHGIYNVVATCGTIFSHRQVITLSRYTKNIVLLFDNDKPGHLSSERVKRKLEEIEHNGVELSYSFVPDGYKDLDEYLLKGGDSTIFGERIEAHNFNIETLW